MLLVGLTGFLPPVADHFHFRERQERFLSSTDSCKTFGCMLCVAGYNEVLEWFSPKWKLTIFFSVDNTGRLSDKMGLTLLQLSWMLLKLEIFGVKSKSNSEGKICQLLRGIFIKSNCMKK